MVFINIHEFQTDVSAQFPEVIRIVHICEKRLFFLGVFLQNAEFIVFGQENFLTEIGASGLPVILPLVE